MTYRNDFFSRMMKLAFPSYVAENAALIEKTRINALEGYGLTDRYQFSPITKKLIQDIYDDINKDDRYAQHFIYSRAFNESYVSGQLGLARARLFSRGLKIYRKSDGGEVGPTEPISLLFRLGNPANTMKIWLDQVINAYFDSKLYGVSLGKFIVSGGEVIDFARLGVPFVNFREKIIRVSERASESSQFFMNSVTEVRDYTKTNVHMEIIEEGNVRGLGLGLAVVINVHNHGMVFRNLIGSVNESAKALLVYKKASTQTNNDVAKQVAEQLNNGNLGVVNIGHNEGVDKLNPDTGSNMNDVLQVVTAIQALVGGIISGEPIGKSNNNQTQAEEVRERAINTLVNYRKGQISAFLTERVIPYYLYRLPMRNNPYKRLNADEYIYELPEVKLEENITNERDDQPGGSEKKDGDPNQE